MDVPPKTAAPAEAAEFTAGRAYEQFWDSVENDAPVGDDEARSAPNAADATAYDQFWELADV